MMRGLKKHFHPIAILSIIAAAFAVYWPSLQNQFVWDDTALILRDPLIRSWRLIPEGFRHFLFTDATASDFYRPVQRLTYVFDYALYAFKPWGYHLTSITLHAAAAVALFLCAQALIACSGRVDARKGGVMAWIAAFVWAIHPVHSAAVSYVAGRADVLAALFGFLGLWFAAKSPVSGRTPCVPTGTNPPITNHQSPITSPCDWLAALCFLLAMLSKESGVMALVIWLVAAGYFFGAAKLRRWFVFAAVIVAVYCGLRFSAENIAPPPGTPVSLAARPILLARAWAEYAGLLVAPANLHMERNVVALHEEDELQAMQATTWRAYQTIAGVALLAAFAAWWRWTRKRAPDAQFFLIAFLLAYLPVSDIFSLNATVAEHWLYFNSAFLFVAAVLSLDAMPLRNGVLTAAAAIWLGCIGARTFVRNYDWKDQRTFLTSTMANGGNTPRMMINMGALESSEGRQKIAISYFLEALQQSPDQPFGLLGLASAYLRSHDYVKARKTLQKACTIPFIYCEALQDMAVLDYQEKRIDRMDLLRKAAGLDPENWATQKRYIKHLAERGDNAEAIHTLQAVIQRQPWRAESWKMLGDLMTKIDKPDLAGVAYERAADEDVHLEITKHE